jgi:hypothetical protein
MSLIIEQEDTGVEWAASSILSLNPPKRTLQTIGVPEPIRQHFQQLDSEALKRTDTEEEDRKGAYVLLIKCTRALNLQPRASLTKCTF